MSNQYTRVYIGFAGHEKAIRAGGDAIWLWLAMKDYAKREGTDGRIPGVKIGRLEGPEPSKQKRLTKRLIEAGLLEKSGDDYWLHDYLEWEESAEQAEERRAAARKRKRDWDARRRGVSNASGNGVTHESGNATSNITKLIQSNLIQSNPSQDPSPDGEGGRGRDPAPPQPLDSDRETLCPLGLAEDFTGYSEIAERFGVPEDALRRGAHEFVSHWTIGGGTGRKKSHWARWLRADLKRKYELGKFAEKPVHGGGLAAVMAAIKVED